MSLMRDETINSSLSPVIVVKSNFHKTIWRMILTSLAGAGLD